MLNPPVRTFLAAVALALAVPSPSNAKGSSSELRFPQLGCSVEGLRSAAVETRFCQVLGRLLERPTRRVADARHVQRGEAIQVFHTDVSWVVALVRDGEVAGWTRLSKGLVVRQHVNDVATAVRELLLHAHPEREEDCIRLHRGKHEPNVRDSDLLYPWAEFEQCSTHMLELAAPWQR